MRPQISSDEVHRIAFGFSPPDDRYVATRLRDGVGANGGTRPAGQGPSGSSAPALNAVVRIVRMSFSQLTVIPVTPITPYLWGHPDEER